MFFFLCFSLFGSEYLPSEGFFVYLFLDLDFRSNSLSSYSFHPDSFVCKIVCFQLELNQNLPQCKKVGWFLLFLCHLFLSCRLSILSHVKVDPLHLILCSDLTEEDEGGT